MAKRKTEKEKREENNKKSAKKLKKSHKKLYFTLLAIVVLIVLALFLVDRFYMPLEDLYKKIFKKETAQTAVSGENDLKVHFVDVGQGDAIIIQLPDGKNMIIDGGDTRTDNWNKLKSYIEKLEITVFDYLMLTHTDADHVGGLDNVFGITEVKTVYMPYIEEGVITTNAYANFLAAVQAEGSQVVHSRMGQKIESEDQNNKYSLTLLSPEQKQYDNLNENKPSNSSYDKNDVSPIMVLEYTGKKIVFTGDANLPIEKQVITNYENGLYGDLDLRNIDLLKAGHHGSNGTGTSAQKTSGSTCQEFLNLLKPKNVVISCGEGNSHHHPHQEVLDRVKAIGAECYRTDNDGDVVATVSRDAGTALTVTTSKTHDPEKNAVAPERESAAAEVSYFPVYRYYGEKQPEKIAA